MTGFSRTSLGCWLVALAGCWGALCPIPGVASEAANKLETQTLIYGPPGNGTQAGLRSVGTPRGSTLANPSRLIVRFRGPPTFITGTPRTQALHDRLNIHLAWHPPGIELTEALQRYRSSPGVLYAEPDFELSTLAAPDDPDYATGKQWDMSLISSESAWAQHTDSSSVVVAVIDTGIDLDHPDLASNLFRHPDDPAVRGYTCMNGNCLPGGDDDNGHGTHVAGTIGAVGNDGLGMVGVNWRVQLLPIKFLGANGSGSTSDAVLGFDLIRQLKARGINVRITNNSWGGGGYSQALLDAMVAVQDGPFSTLHVCAAGNSALNADHQPMYPAAYPSRGIVSVMATDRVDQAASFTNYGLASVDLAAPGVDIHSTVPVGTCSHCTPTGYKLLSGTSMAAPHVAGVAAALLSREPGLSAALARDALLAPGSTDPLVHAAALRTSTGGRLNFAATINNNAFLSNPSLNAFPVIQIGTDTIVGPGSWVDFPQQVTDPDGDTLRTIQGRVNLDTGRTWLLGWRANRVFPSTVPFSAPALGRIAAMSYELAATDGRGGGVSGRNWAIVTPSAGTGLPPTGILTVPATAAVGETVVIGFDAIDPEGGQVTWDMHASGTGGSSGLCCMTGNSVGRTFNQAGVYRVTVQGIDQELHTSPTYSAVIRVGGATGQPPLVRATASQLAGPAPLVVEVDASASSDEDGFIRTYFFDCAQGYASGQAASFGQCTFTEPGSYWLRVFVTDDHGLMGTTSLYVVAIPPGNPLDDRTPPEVALVAPVAGSTVAGSVTIAANAWDDLSGVSKVGFYLDGDTDQQQIGAAFAAPFEFLWDPAEVAPGYHELKARAWDRAGNASPVSTIGIDVQRPPTPPMPPHSIRAVQVSTNVEVSWQDASTNETGFRVARETYNAKRKRWGDSVILVPQTQAGTTTYVDLSPTAGTYRYSVQAFNETGSSGWAGPTDALVVTASGGGKRPR